MNRANTNQKKTGITVTSDKIDFKARNFPKRSTFHDYKRLNLLEDIIIQKMYATKDNFKKQLTN